MAKTESTAVNNLIELVQSNQGNSIVDPENDLFSAPKSAKEIPALPRTRAPVGTSQLDVPQGIPSVRMMTAPPTRGATVPPIPQRNSAPPLPHKAPDGTPAPQRTSGAALPPPRPSASLPAPRTSSAPSLPSPPSSPRMRAPSPSLEGKVAAPQPNVKSGPVNSRVTPASLAAVAPLTYPVVARPSKIDMTGDMVRGEDWFEASRAVEKFDDETYVGTSPHVLQDRRAGTSLAKKLILPSIGFIIVGALIGGFIAFNTDGKKPAHPDQAKAALPVAAPASHATVDNAARADAIAHGTNTGVPAAAAAQPTVAQPSAAQPTAAQPTAAQPSAAQPTAAQPTAEQPTAAQPTAAQIAVAQPAAPTPPPVAQSAPPAQQLAAAAPNEHEVQTTRGVVKLSDVRIDSIPSGATVTLVEHTATGEKKSFLGTTPLATSVDASHDYDVVVALAGHPEQTAHLDPARSPHVQIALSGKAPVTAIAKETPKAAPAPATPAPKHHAVAKTPLADPGFDSKPAPAPPIVAEKPKAEKAEKAAGGSGTLMISSKPPCEIVIDGKATGLSTPQRAMALPAGAHKVTLVNAGEHIEKTMMVQINADQPTKLVKDLLAN